MASFRFPRQLLHSMTEPQWLPRSKEEEGSRLDELERQEEAYQQRLRQQVLPDAPEPIGLAGDRNETSTTTAAAAAARKVKLAAPATDVEVMALPPSTTFWEKHRDQVDHELHHHHHAAMHHHHHHHDPQQHDEIGDEQGDDDERQPETMARSPRQGRPRYMNNNNNISSSVDVSVSSSTMDVTMSSPATP